MKEKLTRNIGLKILSVILAVILWLVITNVDDPIKHKTFYNVMVDILNEDEIAALNQVYEITSGKTIDFTFAARRSVADKITVSDFKVTADLSKLSDVNAVSINISCPRYEDEITITDGMNEVMKVELEELVSKSYAVNVVQKGEPADGNYVYKKESKTLITVSGPKNKIDKISAIIAEVDVSDMTGNFQSYAKPKAVDKEGNTIDASNLTFSQETVRIDIGMYRTKIIDLNIKTKGKPADGFVKTGPVKYEPKSIEIAAEDEVLKNISEFTISESIEGASENIVTEINLQEKLGSGIFLVGDNQSVVVNITVEKAVTKEVSIWPGDIIIKNLPEMLVLNYLTTGPIAIKITGAKEDVEGITRDTISPVIDLFGKTSGTYSLTLGIDIEGNATVTNNPVVSIQLVP